MEDEEKSVHQNNSFTAGVSQAALPRTAVEIQVKWRRCVIQGLQMFFPIHRTLRATYESKYCSKVKFYSC